MKQFAIGTLAVLAGACIVGGMWVGMSKVSNRAPQYKCPDGMVMVRGLRAPWGDESNHGCAIPATRVN